MQTVNKIAVIGLGYIGLPTAVSFALQGIEVVGVDINQKIIERLCSGNVHLAEPGLEILVNQVIREKYLRVTTTLEAADVFLITVQTPIDDSHCPDLSYVMTAVHTIAPFLETGNLVILESTSPVGTMKQIVQLFAQLRPDLMFPKHTYDRADVHLAYCPERVMPGRILKELIDNDRIIGGMTPACARAAKTLYQLFVKGKCLTTNSDLAEMAKLTENAFRDVNLAFANELSMICDKLNMNVWELIRLANHHPRVNILQPSAGVGGHCIAVDPWFIVQAASKETTLIQAARIVNDNKPYFILEKIKDTLKTADHAATIVACLGLTYKADTDDLRESPALNIIEQLLQTTAVTVWVVEPHIQQLPPVLAQYHRCQLVTLQQALSADYLIWLVNHRAFYPVAHYPANRVLNFVSDQASLMADEMTVV